ncbi:DUF1835 domain-containing protein [Mucilaginibacter terrenus]|uniref:DUF1835 domain-containing protein n=1 Tax=Mucilaginibacter terrenus TaxID=2482727 RepID=A0A3E2NP81_9SPHI|nr:DUF1835 domain-containing protein [Mucilaginibacter terrenus]RFZ82794.1 DUF1835 domain-containing protein [Mucilaginibacter terrenus]
MNATTLHILNGDATLTGFNQAGIDGDVMIWREALSEGPVILNVDSAEFWQLRSDWVCSTFNETPENYHTGMIVPLEMLNEPYEEINLWFEFDLHCQVNLLAVMMLLRQQTNLSQPAVYLISPNEFPGVNNFNGMGELDGEQLDYLYDNIRLQLSDYDFTLAAEAWKLYIIGDKALLEQWLIETPFWGNMHNLKAAMQAQVQRLHVDSEGLNHIHHKLLAIYNAGYNQKGDICRQFWQTEKIYGMGDAQLDIYLQQLVDKGLITTL